MRIFTDLSRLEPGACARPAATLGVFDGVHRGHQRLFGVLAGAADRHQGDAVVVTFDRHPRQVLTGVGPPTITSLEHRLVLFERAGIDATLVLHFDRAFAEMPAEAFVRDILVGRLGARAIVLGRDAHFGRGRDGGVDLLARLAPALGFELVEVDLVPQKGAGGVVVSSTAIRAAIQQGHLDSAADMLGREVSLLGRVARGAARGRTIGFPTANLELHQEVTPPRGVYAGSVEVDGVRYPTMQNLGVRPTFAADGIEVPSREVLEVHLIGFEGDLYGRVLEVAFHRRLRDEVRFASREALVEQLAFDRAAALGAPAARGVPG